MRREKQLWVVVLLAVAALLVSSPSTFGAGLRLEAPQVTGYSTSGNVVRVSVSNTGPLPQLCAVVVQAVVNGAPVVATTVVLAGAGRTTTVSVLLPSSPTEIIKVGAIQDGGEPY